LEGAVLLSGLDALAGARRYFNSMASDSRASAGQFLVGVARHRHMRYDDLDTER
jgi:hypothetical protein